MLPTVRDERYVEFFREHPFFGLNDERIRTRAYYLSRSIEAAGSIGDWLEAEWRELVEGLDRYVSFVHLGKEPGPVEFVDLYRPLVAYAFGYDDQKQVLIGDRGQPRRCTICGLTAPTVRFKSAAHVIPQALGNKCLKTRDECDDCNNLYGRTHDQELAAFLRPELTLARVSGQGGPKKYSLGSGRSSMGGASRADAIPVEIREDDPSFSIEYTENGFTIKTPGVTFSPMHAMKSIARATWHVLGPERRAKYDALRRWIRGEIDAKPMQLFHNFIPLTGFTKLGMIVWESRSASAHPVVTMMFTGHSLLVLCLPRELETGNVGLKAFPPLPKMFPRLRIHEIIASTSDRITTKDSSIDIVVAGDSFPMTVGERCPVMLVSPTLQQWRAELEVDAVDDASLFYKLRRAGIVLDIVLSRTTSDVNVSLAADLPSVPINDAVAALELLCLLHDGTPITVGVEAGKGPSRLFTLENAPNPTAAEPWRNSLELAQAIERLAARSGAALIYPAHPDQEAAHVLLLDQITSTGQSVVTSPSTLKITISPKQPVADPGDVLAFSVGSKSIEVQGRSFELGPCDIQLFGARVVNEQPRADGLLDIDVECSSHIRRYPKWAPTDSD